jgi:Arc/MetJ-type ribon-helix-helix transcriptional regulator
MTDRFFSRELGIIKSMITIQRDEQMGKTKVAVTIDAEPIIKIDRLIEKKIFANRSQAIEEALYENIERIEHRRLAEECAKLDPVEEHQLAEEGMTGEIETWPE